MIRDLFFAGVLGSMVALGFWRPFLFIPGFIYADLARPQYLSYSLLQPIPVSQILFFFAFLSWLFSRSGHGGSWGLRQLLLVGLLFYCGLTTLFADYPDSALDKWDWVWKVLAFALLLPLTLVSRLRVEAILLVTVLSVAANSLSSAGKTLLGGSRYGSATMLIESNSGMYESSTFACLAIAIIPMILCLFRQGTIFPAKSRWVRLFCLGLIMASLLVPVATEARTGLACVVMLALLLLRFVKRPLLYLIGAPVLMAFAIPILPASFMERMATLNAVGADSSAAVRLAVWRWTLEYAVQHPFGGGFDAYLGNQLRIDLTLNARLDADNQSAAGPGGIITQSARAFHSAYFEMLGEQGWPGLFLWLILHAAGLIRMEQLYRRHRREGPQHDPWLATIALGLQQAHIIYLTGALFVGIAFNPFAFHLIGMEIALRNLSRRAQASLVPNASSPRLFAR